LYSLQTKIHWRILFCPGQNNYWANYFVWSKISSWSLERKWWWCSAIKEGKRGLFMYSCDLSSCLEENLKRHWSVRKIYSRPLRESKQYGSTFYFIFIRDCPKCLLYYIIIICISTYIHIRSSYHGTIFEIIIMVILYNFPVIIVRCVWGGNYIVSEFPTKLCQHKKK